MQISNNTDVTQDQDECETGCGQMQKDKRTYKIRTKPANFQKFVRSCKNTKKETQKIN